MKLAHAAAAKSSSSAISSPLWTARGGDERRRAVELARRPRARRRLERLERPRAEHAEAPRVREVVVGRPARELEQLVERRRVDRARLVGLLRAPRADQLVELHASGGYLAAPSTPALMPTGREPAVALAREVDGRRGAARAQPRPARRRRRPHARGPARAQGRLAAAHRPRGARPARLARRLPVQPRRRPATPSTPPHAIVTEPAGVRALALGRPAPALGARARPRPPGAARARPRRHPGRAGHGARHRRGARSPRSRGSSPRTSTLRRFRTNLHLELDAEPWAELGWAGARSSSRAACGSTVDGPCERCAIPTRDPDTQEKWPELLQHLAAAHGQNFGLLARVRVPGRVAAGEQVRIVTA